MDITENNTVIFNAADRRQAMEIAFDPFYCYIADGKHDDDYMEEAMQFVAINDTTNDDEKMAQQHAAMEVLVKEYVNELRGWMDRKLALAEAEQNREGDAKAMVAKLRRSAQGHSRYVSQGMYDLYGEAADTIERLTR